MKPESQPELGDTVEIEIHDGHAVRNPLDASRLSSGDRVPWSTFYARRQRDGALTPSPITTTTKARKAKAGAQES